MTLLGLRLATLPDARTHRMANRVKHDEPWRAERSLSPVPLNPHALEFFARPQVGDSVFYSEIVARDAGCPCLYTFTDPRCLSPSSSVDSLLRQIMDLARLGLSRMDALTDKYHEDKNFEAIPFIEELQSLPSDSWKTIHAPFAFGSKCFDEGDYVVVTVLAKQPFPNDTVGQVDFSDEASQRWAVRLDSGKVLLLKPLNLGRASDEHVPIFLSLQCCKACTKGDACSIQFTHICGNP